MKRNELLYFVLIVVFAANCSQGEELALPKFFSKQKVEQPAQDTPAVKTSPQTTALREENAQLRQESAQLREELLQERLARLAARQDSVNSVLVQMEAALEQAREDSLAAIQARDSLLQKQLFATQMSKEIQERLINNSKALDVQLGKLEEQKGALQQQMSLEQKQVEIAEKKIAVFKEEQELYNSRKQKLWVDQAPQNELDELAASLSAVEKSIEVEKSKIKTATAKITGIQETIDGIDKQREKLNAAIQRNYTAKEVLEATIAQEQEALSQELARLDSVQQSRPAALQALLQEKAAAEAYLASLEAEKDRLQESPSAPDSLSADTIQAVTDQPVAQPAAPTASAEDSLGPQQEEQAYSREAEKNRQFYYRFLSLLGLLLFLVITFYFLRRRARKRK